MHKTKGKEFRNSQPVFDFGYVPVNIHTYFNLQVFAVIVYRKFCADMNFDELMLWICVNTTFDMQGGQVQIS